MTFLAAHCCGNPASASGSNTFNIGDTATALGLSGKTSVSTGTGLDHVFVKRTTNPLDVHGQNGAGVVDVGNANNSQGIRGAVLVDNVLSKSVLRLHNSADATARGVALDSDTITILETVTGLAPAKVGSARVIVEGKTKGATTHDALTYSDNAATHTRVHPYLRYGMLVGS
jgi:hypothetical protein